MKYREENHINFHRKVDMLIKKGLKGKNV